MDQIDESKRKPRRTKGTPSYHYRNRFALAVIAAGTTIFGLFTLTPVYRKANEKLLKVLSTRSEEELERIALFSMPTPRTTKLIQEALDEKNKFYSER